MKILIAGGYDTQNLGDYASFLGLYKVLTSAIPDCHFSVLSRHPDDEFARQFDARVILNLDHPNKVASKGRFFHGFNDGDNGRHIQTLRDTLVNSDCMVLGNGRLFIDICLGFMQGPLSYYVMLVGWAKLLNKPVILSSVTLVHPETALGKQHLQFILENATAIIVREAHSVDVAKHYCRNHGKIKLLPDIAFAVDRMDAQDTKTPVVTRTETIGITFRGVDFSTVVGKQELETMAHKVSYLLDESNASVVLIPQCTYNVDTPLTDDRTINKAVYESLNPEHQQRCTLIENRLTLKQTLKLYQQLSYVFTSRRHGFIMALTQGTQASLICNESNTTVVQQSIPIPRLFIDKDDNFSVPSDKRKEAKLILANLRDKCKDYASCFMEACNQDAFKNIG